jgi:anaerobic magnesium-protoporphyrin IX monomethyl ester cyclase
MFNVCLIQPPIADFYTTNVRNIPLGLLSIGASLKRKHNVRLLDLRIGKACPIPVPVELADVAEYYRSNDASPFSLYKRYSHYGTPIDQLAELLPMNIDVFLVSALFSTYIFETLTVITIIHKKYANAKIIAGGSGAVFHAQEFFRTGTNFIFQGEGEIACQRLLDELKKPIPVFSTIPNLIWRKDGKIHRNPVITINNINDLPYPDYTLPGVPDYQLAGEKHAMLVASRGCPYQCKFCCVHQIFGQKYRLRSVENVLGEIGQKVSRGFRSFDFEDDHFGGNRRWLNDLLDGISRDFSDYKLSFQAMNGITASNLDSVLLQKMKAAGFHGVNLSLVTPDQNRQSVLKRPFTTQQFSDIVIEADKIGLSVTAYLIIGLPDDSADENLRSILFLADLPVLIGPALFYLVPGTPLFDELQQAGHIPTSPRCFRSSYFPHNRPAFSRTSALTLFRICRIINFLKAARKYHYRPSGYRIAEGTIIMPDKLSGKQSQITVGFALLEIMKNSGILYGTGRKQAGRYPLITEDVDRDLIEVFTKSKIFSAFTNPFLSAPVRSIYH